jgi:hypothetical protein
MRTRRGRAILATVVCLGAGLVAAAPAGAVGCAAFKTAVESANNGDVITLDAGLTCNDTYLLPGGKNPLSITIQGGGTGATLDGSGKGTRIMTATPDPGSQAQLTIRNLTFRHGTVSGAGGGALGLEGAHVSATLDHDRFFDNSATGGAGSGGAVNIKSSGSSAPVTVSNSAFGDGTAANANTASSGGAIAITSFTSGPSATVRGNIIVGNSAATTAGGLLITQSATGAKVTVSDNVITGNTAHQLGGGALVFFTNSMALLRNRFSANRIHATAGSEGLGGGAIVSGDATSPLTQQGNRFDRNSITRGGQSNFHAGGGGEWIDAVTLASRNDRFTANSLPAGSGSGDAEGAGLAIEGCPNPPAPKPLKARLENAVAAANTGAVNTHGAGVYAGGCGFGPLALTVLDSTISGNTTSGAGATSGLSGGPDDKLTLRNSIVAGSFGGPANVSGFGAGRKVTNSDACGPTKLPGAGNICAPPNLVDAPHANVHETGTSPTLNRGANASIPAGLTIDFEGQKRILNHRVDMGADEFTDPFAGLTIPKQSVEVSGGAARIQVRCSATVAGPCSGTLTLVRKGDGGKGVKLGHHGFKVGRGATARVKVKLNADGRSLLAKNSSVDVQARAVTRDRLGTKRSSSGRVRLKLPK